MILGLRTFIAHVRPEQLDAAKAWYTLFAGVAPHHDKSFYVGFNVGGFELGLQPEGEPGPGGTVTYWGTADIAAEVARRRARRDRRAAGAGRGRGHLGGDGRGPVRQSHRADPEPALRRQSREVR